MCIDSLVFYTRNDLLQVVLQCMEVIDMLYIVINNLIVVLFSILTMPL